MTLIKRLLLPLLAMLAMATPAVADERTEAFVRQNGQLVLDTLNDPGLGMMERAGKFADYMDEFSDMRFISRFVIGEYGRRFSKEDLAAYQTAFRRYALTNYEVQFDQYRGESIEVLGSQEIEGGRRFDSVVHSQIITPGEDPFEVRWRIQERGGKLQIIDVGLNLGGTLVWLAGEQKAQFRSFLGRNNGSATALIELLEELTSELEAQRRVAELEATKSRAG